MNYKAYGYAAVTMFSLGMSAVAQAELQPISDQAMGEVTGQAFMEVENIENVTGSTLDYTRMTLGLDVETRVNIDDVTLGGTADGADLAASRVALGHIARVDGVEYNGKSYLADETVPFEAARPYLELAENPTDKRLVGFRMGFEQARGSVSSVTSNFSGNIGLRITDDSTGNVYDAALFDASTQATDYRATHIGIDDAAVTTDCATGANCAPLSHAQSLIVGQDNGGTTDFTSDFFIGFQAEDVPWQSPAGANVINAGKGVYLNLPTSMTVKMSELSAGLPRLRTHQNDLGTKLF
ncbi:hypothetical protein LPB19_14955 [Marinobacter salinisoli]|uniref:DUF6160 domain-containing protein n=1 Tax=Marinobacter salinisoli TaxID=2769486 RepID=A0ABX7MW45_9GAMM|nr:DUF6160 family protein [Marinobacter salinisoli]QSP94458.1 hypothetical protein LPB19_14955 [Marinobacter salinisoli]